MAQGLEAQRRLSGEIRADGTISQEELDALLASRLRRCRSDLNHVLTRSFSIPMRSAIWAHLASPDFVLWVNSFSSAFFSSSESRLPRFRAGAEAAPPAPGSVTSGRFNKFSKSAPNRSQTKSQPHRFKQLLPDPAYTLLFFFFSAVSSRAPSHNFR